jgi:predicted ATP-grasp superfamily ATP-dependent carboligase
MSRISHQEFTDGDVNSVPPPDRSMDRMSIQGSSMTPGQAGLPTAIIIGGDVNGLGVARALARHNIPILMLDTDPARPTMRTRYGRKMALPELSGEGLIESLYELRPQFTYKPVLFPTQEAGLATLSSVYSEIRNLYHLALPPHETVQMMLDKNLFQAQAEHLGFLVPRSLQLTRGGPMAGLELLRYPCVLKPAAKDEAYARHFAKAYRVTSPGEAAAIWIKMELVIETAIVQEWIEGGDSDVYFCLQYRSPAGREPISFVGRKTLQWPTLVGGTATCIPAPEVEPELIATTSSFFSLADFVGLCSMEYKYDHRDRKFYMVEPTAGRTDYQEEIAVLNGVNLPFAAWCDLTGIFPGPVIEQVPPVGWRDPFGHHNAVASGAKDPVHLLMPNLKLADAYYRLNDPMPYLQARLGPFLKRFERKSK